MADYEFLVIADERLGTLGRPCACLAKGHEWGRLEGPPDFAVVRVSGDEKQIEYLRENARYDFATEAWVNSEEATAVSFERDVIAGVKPVDDQKRLEDAADAVAGVKVADPQAYFKPSHVEDLAKYRDHWIAIAWPFREDKAVAEFIAVVKGGSCYGTIREKLLAIDEKIREEFKGAKEIAAADIEWMEKTLKVSMTTADRDGR